jgi:hypothetical protein
MVGFGTFTEILFYVSYFKGMGVGVGACVSCAWKFQLLPTGQFLSPWFLDFYFYLHLEHIILDLRL